MSTCALQVKGLLTSLYAVLWHNVQLTHLGWSGFALNSSGGMLYTLGCYYQKKREKEAAARDVTNGGGVTKTEMETKKEK